MSRILETFKRYELKYMLTRSQAAALRRAMHGHMALDLYGHCTIRNIYYDTDSFRLVRRSMEKPFYKEKLRVRSYRKAGEKDPVFVELKKKYEGVVYKRRIALPHRDAVGALADGTPLPADTQIAREIEAFRTFYGPTLGPVMLLSYEREAFAPADGTDFRFTLDENILWRTHHIDLGASVFGSPVIPEGAVLLEVKTPGGIPLWMVRFLSENGIRQISFSKYGEAYRQLRQNTNAMGGLLYA